MDNKEYILPSMELLRKTNEVFDKKSRYFSLSKLLFKKDMKEKLLIPLGISDDNEKYFVNLNNIPAMLIGGETGSGKSVFLDCLIITLLLKNTPNDLKFIFMDPKQVELGWYDGIPHLLKDTIVNSKNSINTLNAIQKEIDSRLETFKNNSCKNIDEYNNISNDKIPHIIIVIDEAVDILKINDISYEIKNIINNGIKTGIHLIIATNSVLKEYINSNLINSFPIVLTFDLASSEQAKYMNLKGSEFLKVYGEAFVKMENTKIFRMQSPYISDDEIKKVINFIKKQK